MIDLKKLSTLGKKFKACEFSPNAESLFKGSRMGHSLVCNISNQH